MSDESVTDTSDSGAEDQGEAPEWENVSIEAPPKYPQSWESLLRHWQKVLQNDNIFASRSGGWLVRLQRDDEKPVPKHEPTEIAVYDTSDCVYNELASWDLDEVSADA